MRRRNMVTRHSLSVVFLWCALPCLVLAGPPPLFEQGAILTLHRAIESALTHHPARLAAQSRVGAAQEGVGVARSGLLPQVAGAAGYLRATNNGIGDTAYLSAPGVPRGVIEGRGVNKLGLSDTFDNYLGTLGAYQFLLDFGRRRGFVSQRDAEADAERARLQLIELDLVFQVTKAYFDLLAAKERVRVFEEAIEQRTQQLHRAQLKARAAGAEIKQYQSDYWPTIGAVGGINVRGQTATPGTNYYAGVVITWPLFNGFLTEHELAAARFRQDAVRHGIEDLRQRIVLEVKSAFLDCQASFQRIEWADRSLTASRAELEVAEKRYASGLGSIIELTEAERRFTEDEATLVRALADLSIDKGMLARNVGEGVSSK